MGGPPLADLQSAAFDLSANPPKIKTMASSSGLTTVPDWPFSFRIMLLIHDKLIIGRSQAVGPCYDNIFIIY
jgi:hypothetical protein